MAYTLRFCSTCTASLGTEFVLCIVNCLNQYSRQSLHSSRCICHHLGLPLPVTNLCINYGTQRPFGSTGVTPCIPGNEKTSPGTHTLDPTQVETIDPVLLDSLIETQKRINKKVSKNTEKAQAGQKKNYDHRHEVSCDIKVGDIVAIKNSESTEWETR